MRVWSDRNGEPLRQKAERYVNMAYIREKLDVSVEDQIKKTILESLGHEIRMRNEMLMKVVLFNCAPLGTITKGVFSASLSQRKHHRACGRGGGVGELCVFFSRGGTQHPFQCNRSHYLHI